MTNTYRSIARITGVLFIVATAASLLSTAFLGSVGDQDYLTKIAANEGQVAAGVLVRFIAAFASAAIAISLYPVLRRYRQGLALGAVGFRIIEGTFYALGAVSVLLLLTLSQEFVKTGAGNPAYFSQSGTLLKALDDWAGLAGIFAFYVGGLLYYRRLLSDPARSSVVGGLGHWRSDLGCGRGPVDSFRRHRIDVDRPRSF